MTTKKTKSKKAKTASSRGKIVGPATLASILGVSAGKPENNAKSANSFSFSSEKVKKEWKKYHATLLGLRERLIQQMDGLAKESAEEMSHYSLHMADSGTDNFDRDFALSLLSSDQDAIYEIEEALRRIERGAYGVCELTGKPIPKARLEAIPWTRFTVAAQAQLEKDGALRQRRLGSLGSVDSTGAVEIEDTDDDDDRNNKEPKE